MPEAIRTATPTAKKQHVCSCCAGAIPAGTTYHRDTYVYDGRVYDWKTCVGCEQLENLVWGWTDPVFDDEGIGPDDYHEWAREHRDDPEHGNAARAFLARWSAARVSGGSSAPSGVTPR